MNDKKNSDRNKKIFIGLGICAVVIICAVVFFIVKGTEKTNKNVSIVDEPEPTVETTTEAEIIDFTLSPVEADDAFYADLEEFNKNYMSYYNENYDSGRLVSVFGFMYDGDTGLPIDMGEIMEEVPEKLKGADLLYVRPGDLEVAEGEIDVDMTDLKLTPFTAVLTEGGYLISSEKYKGGLFTQEEYKELLMRYNINHGEVKTPEKDSSLYNKITDAVVSNWGTSNTVDFKYIGCDDRFAVAVANTVEDPLDMREYLLEKSGTSWMVRSKALAVQLNVKQFVNEMYPSMNLSLLPYYNLAEHTEIRTGLTGYYDQIVASEDLGVNKEDLWDVYCLYADDFIYYEFKGGKKVLGHIEDGLLTFYKVETTDEAVALMSSFTDKPPVFIIKFG